jgi:hypothetical protein
MLSEGQSKLLAREILIRIKGNERAFDDFIGLIRRNGKERDVCMFVLKRFLIDQSMKMYSKV